MRAKAERAFDGTGLVCPASEQLNTIGGVSPLGARFKQKSAHHRQLFNIQF
jgi:hypothetical protein